VGSIRVTERRVRDKDKCLHPRYGVQADTQARLHIDRTNGSQPHPLPNNSGDRMHVHSVVVDEVAVVVHRISKRDAEFFERNYHTW
jgi:hypothetical protein